MRDILVIFILVTCKAVLSDHQSEETELLHRIKRQSAGLSDCRKCGVSFQIGSKSLPRIPFIVNGTAVASPENYPWMVGLNPPGYTSICGGAIISKFFILTAAHCVVQQGGAVYQQLEISFLRPEWGGRARPNAAVADIMFHPGYLPNREKNDIALLRLLRPIRCNMFANPICLPPRNLEMPPGKIVKITGYGSTAGLGTPGSERLLEGLIQVRRKSECHQVQGFQARSTYCMRGYHGQSGCFGDSGGSMFAGVPQRRSNEVKYVTLGLASMQTSDACDWKANMLYTSVEAHLQWIYQMMYGG